MIKTFKYALRIIKIAWKANGINFVIFLFSIIYETTLFPFFQVYLLAKALDLLETSSNLVMQDFTWIIVFFILGFIVKILFSSYIHIADAYLSFKMGAYLDLEINNKLASLDPATFEDPKFQDLIAQTEGAKGAIDKHVFRVIEFINSAVKLVTATIVTFSFFPYIAPVIFIATIPSYLAWDRMRKKTWTLYTTKRSILIRVTGYIKTLFSSDSTSKETAIYETGPVLLNKIKKQQKKYFQIFRETNNPRYYEIVAARFIQFAAFIYTQFLNMQAVLRHTLSVGQFTLVFQQSLNLAIASEDVLNEYSSITMRHKQLEQFFKFMETEKQIKRPEKPEEVPSTPVPPVIEFKNVSFRYPGTKRDILKGFNLTIRGGEKIALVGENGAGKTTIIKLLLRFHDVTEGEVLINGVNIKNIDLDHWYNQVGALFQDFIKYQFTFKENVYFGDLSKSAKMEYLKDAITKSGADAYLDKLPRKENQVVGKMFKKGVDLSGGQWQKLALARAFYRNAPLLILDEPTSAIDAKAEYEIFQRVQNLQKDKTVFVISHRFSTVRNADRIIVLNDGRIIEEGNHQELMQKKGLYEELFTIQAKGYK